MDLVARKLMFSHMNNKVSKEAKIRNRFNQVSHLTQDTSRESDKHNKASHTREPRGEPDHKAAMNRQESKTNTKHKKQKLLHKRSTALKRSVKKLLEGLNQFHGANLTFSLDVDQDT